MGLVLPILGLLGLALTLSLLLAGTSLLLPLLGGRTILTGLLLILHLADLIFQLFLRRFVYLFHVRGDEQVKKLIRHRHTAAAHCCHPFVINRFIQDFQPLVRLGAFKLIADFADAFKTFGSTHFAAVGIYAAQKLRIQVQAVPVLHLMIFYQAVIGKKAVAGDGLNVSNALFGAGVHFLFGFFHFQRRDIFAADIDIRLKLV